MTSPIDEVGQSFSRLMRLSARAKSKVGANQGLNFKSSGILIHLAISGPARSSEIGELLNFDPAVVSRETRKLINLGLIERIPDPHDGRATKLQCTEKGIATYNRNKAFRRSFFEDLLKSWAPEDIETLNHLLNTLTSDFEAKLSTDDHTTWATNSQEK